MLYTPCFEVVWRVLASFYFLLLVVCRHTGSYARTHTHTNTRVSNFPCLGSIINDDNSLSVDITHRIKKWIRACCVCNWLMASKLFNNYTKRKLHVTLVRPAVNYMHETWTLALGDINNLRVFGRQIVSNCCPFLYFLLPFILHSYVFFSVHLILFSPYLACNYIPFAISFHPLFLLCKDAHSPNSSQLLAHSSYELYLINV